MAGMMMVASVFTATASNHDGNPSTTTQVEQQNPKNMSQTNTLNTIVEPVKANGSHYYVSRNTGRGRIASKEQPAKEIEAHFWNSWRIAGRFFIIFNAYTHSYFIKSLK